MSYENTECLDDLVAVVEAQSHIQEIHRGIYQKQKDVLDSLTNTVSTSMPYISIGLASFTMYCSDNMRWPTYIPVSAAAFVFAAYHINTLLFAGSVRCDKELDEIASHSDQIDQILQRALKHYRESVCSDLKVDPEEEPEEEPCDGESTNPEHITIDEPEHISCLPHNLKCSCQDRFDGRFGDDFPKYEDITPCNAEQNTKRG